MFDGPLTPTDTAFAPYTTNLALFTSFIQPTLSQIFRLALPGAAGPAEQPGLHRVRKLWNDVTGFNPNAPGGAGISGNMAYAITCGARYLSRDNRNSTRRPPMTPPSSWSSGLLPTDFNNPVGALSFTSSKTASHNSPAGTFSTLEGMPHNQVHNYIGGVGALDPGPYGNMTNFLSPVDPIFFLHHANMDRLWDVWTRKQKALNLPYLPPQPDLKTLSDEPFLFFVNGKGNTSPTERPAIISAPMCSNTTTSRASAKKSSRRRRRSRRQRLAASRARQGQHRIARLAECGARAASQRPAAAPAVAQVTLPHPGPASSGPSFDVLVNAPASHRGAADSPFYAGTIAFFGAMTAEMRDYATFVVPLPNKPQVFGRRPRAGAMKGPASDTT